VAGPNGNTGPTVIKTLAASGFEVTALTRSIEKTKPLHSPDIKVVEVDYLSHDSLVSALQGIDAVVVCGVGMSVPQFPTFLTALFLPPTTQLTSHPQATRTNQPNRRRHNRPRPALPPRLLRWQNLRPSPLNLPLPPAKNRNPDLPQGTRIPHLLHLDPNGTPPRFLPRAGGDDKHERALHDEI
jgi:hypothetical protein